MHTALIQNSGSPSLLSQLKAARSAPERRRWVNMRLRALGFDWHIYGRVAMRHGTPLPGSFEALHGDRRWALHYFAAGYHRIDPVLRAAQDCSLPWCWSVDELLDTAAADEPRSRRYLENLKRSGWRSGMTLTTPCPSLQSRSILSISSRSDKLVGSDVLYAHVMEIIVSLNEFYGRTGPRLPMAQPTPALSGQQIRILQCVQRGLKDREIAAQLGLSVAGVDYHLRQLRQRFAVRSRLQLTQAASPLQLQCHPNVSHWEAAA